jgi:outer membrane protein OmpA-like peptidoglycan-associated protein
MNGCPPSDRDGDGILDRDDACPAQAGPRRADRAKTGCPARDADNDGILDEADACPAQAGPRSDDPKKNGCPPPPDQDADGVPDADDACPALAGLKTIDPTTNGCPGDSDGDGFRDDLDACPQEKGIDDPDPAKRGCPKAVRVTAGEIVILEQVQFDTNKATVKPASEELLAAVAQVMKDHPEITRVEVQGHTDDRGKKKRNAKLSQARAEAVAAILVARGIEPGRLVAKGYGQDRPLAPNDSAENRQKNRRVQFVILEKATGASGPETAPAAPIDGGTTP